jgi:hypothetical protein
VDEKGKFWFPVPAQIGSRCQAWIEAQEGSQRESPVDEIARIKRDKAEHPEKYPSDEEMAAFGREMKELIQRRTLEVQNAEESKERQWERRRRELREQARDVDGRIMADAGPVRRDVDGRVMGREA